MSQTPQSFIPEVRYTLANPPPTHHFENPHNLTWPTDFRVVTWTGAKLSAPLAQIKYGLSWQDVS